MIRVCKRGFTILLLAVFLFGGRPAKAEVMLKLNGVSLSDAGDFAARYPDIRLAHEDYKYYETTGELVSDLLLGAFDYDIFELSNSHLDYRTIMEKGYCLDLSSSGVIRKAMQELHPVFAEQCMQNGKIYALPHSMQLNYIAISSSALKKAGLEGVNIPTTFPAFLDFLDDWIAHLKANPDCEVALLGKGFWGDPSEYHADSYIRFLVDVLLENYMMQKEYAGETIRFDEAALQPLLERCYQIGKELYLYDPAVQVPSSILERVASLFIDGYDFLSLRLQDTQPHLISVYVNLYAAHAATQHPEQCIAFMEALCQHNWPQYNAYFYQGAEPLLDPQYDRRVEKMEELIQDTKRQLGSGNLEASYRAELEYRLEKQQANLQKMQEVEEEKYLVSAADLERFRAHADCLFVQMPGIFHAGDIENADALKQLKKRFSTGQMDAMEFLTELNRVSWMLEMERE